MSSRWIRAALWTVAILAPGGLMLVPLLIAAGRKSQDLGSRAGSPAALPAAPTAGAHLG
ncbi:MAG: hypothetical protein GX607_20125 [Myxococcales bacterium]|nr:hypothetical protein [Myxococcales bacterium]